MTHEQQMEAILFVTGDVVSWQEWKKRCQWEKDQVIGIAQTVQERLQKGGSALMLAIAENGIALVTRPEYGEKLDRIFGKEAEEPLSRPALETLALLAYRGPLTRPELDRVRGVHCGMMLRHLSMRGLVEEVDVVVNGEPRYGITTACLQVLGVPNVEALPDFEAWKTNAVIQSVLQPPTP